MYIEASFPRSAGDKAMIRSPTYRRPPFDTCAMTFWYHMYGSTIGTLNVYVNYAAKDNLFWTKKGNQGDVWLSATVPLPRSKLTTTFSVSEILSCAAARDQS